MDATGWAIAGAIVTNVGAILTFLIKTHYEDKKRREEIEAADRRRREDREQDRLDRKAAAELTASHRDLMANKVDSMVEKIDVNTVATVVAAEASTAAAAKADALQESATKIQQQTNGMQEKLMQLAGDAGFQKGVDAEKKAHPTPVEIVNADPVPVTVKKP